MNCRTKKHDLKYCEDATFDLIYLNVQIFDMIILEKPGKIQEFKKLYEGALQHENDSDMEWESLEYDDYYVL